MIDDDDEPYCIQCLSDGNDLACIANYANGTLYKCKICGREFINDREWK